MTTIANIHELGAYLCVDVDGKTVDEVLRGIRRNLYKYTDCGAWLSPQHDHYTGVLVGVRVGSIVEGSDVEVEADDLEFPFTPEAWEEAVAYVEAEAALEWESANREDYA